MDGKPLNSRSAALGLWTTLVLCTVVVASRRISGAYTGPLPTAALMVAVLLAIVTSMAALWMFRQNQPRADCSLPAWLPELTAWGLPTLFSVVIAAGATPAQAGTLLGVAAIGAVVLGVAVLETTTWWATLLASDSSRTESLSTEVAVAASNASPIEDGGATRGSADASPSLHESELPRDEDTDDETTTQWMTRRDEPDGEAIEGILRVHFAPGQREAVVHVTFCPPLPMLPDVELECVDGDDWQMKTEAALPYGLRIQVRRSTAVTLEQSGRIAYLATSQRPARAA